MSPAINPFLYCILSKRFRRGFQDLKRKVNKWFNSSSTHSSSNQEAIYVHHPPTFVRSLPNYPSVRHGPKKVQTRSALLRHTEDPTNIRNDIDIEMTGMANQRNELDHNNDMNLVSIHKETRNGSNKSEEYRYKDNRSSQHNTKGSSVKENCKYKVIFKTNLNSDTSILNNDTSRKQDYSMNRSFKRFSRLNDLRNVEVSSPSFIINFNEPTSKNGDRFNESTKVQDAFDNSSFIEESFRKCVSDK